jgi:hypothetical protein
MLFVQFWKSIGALDFGYQAFLPILDRKNGSLRESRQKQNLSGIWGIQPLVKTDQN